MNFTLVDHWSDGQNQISKERVSIQPLKIGHQIRIGVVNGPMGLANIVDENQDSYWVEGTLQDSPPPPLNLTIALAYTRPKMMRRTLVSLIELGVKDIRLFRSYLCDRNYENSELFQSEDLRLLARRGLEQACDTCLPKIETFSTFRPFLEDSLLKDIPSQHIGVAHTGGRPHQNVDLHHVRALIFGPERGFTEKEIHLLHGHGMTLVQFGDRHLRFETAVPYAVGHWSALSLFS